MLMTGQEYLDSIRDGRRVYIGGEKVEDVTEHPAFRNAARSFAMIYDRKRAPENRDVMTCEEDGETFSTYFLLPRSRADLQRRFETHRRIASWTHGLLGRGPDNFPSYVSGLAMDPAMFDRIRKGFGDNNVLDMTVDDIINYGDSMLAIGKTHGLPLRARLGSHTSEIPQPGSTLRLGWSPADAHVLARSS